jgi:hypothetical protein
MQILSKIFDLSQVMATLCWSAEMIKYVTVTEVCRIDRNSTVHGDSKNDMGFDYHTENCRTNHQLGLSVMERPCIQSIHLDASNHHPT